MFKKLSRKTNIIILRAWAIIMVLGIDFVVVRYIVGIIRALRLNDYPNTKDYINTSLSMALIWLAFSAIVSIIFIVTNSFSYKIKKTTENKSIEK
jgi:hypothetical protein